MAAFRGVAPFREVALRLISEPNLEFWYSPLLELETTLQPTYHKQKEELAFHAKYFKVASCFGDMNRILEIGGPEAKRFGVPIIDALHLAAANLAKCSLFITTEKPDKPMYRTKLVRVVGLAELASELGLLHRLLR